MSLVRHQAVQGIFEIRKTLHGAVDGEHAKVNDDAEEAEDSIDILQAFKIMDRDGDGIIDVAALRAGLSEFGEELTEEEAEQLFAKMDADNDGAVKYEEFVKMVTWVCKENLATTLDM